MMKPFKPKDAEALLEIIKEATSKKEPLEILGLGTRQGLGRPIEIPRSLQLSELKGIVLYEPEELVLTAKAGTSLADIIKTLDEAGQMLAFDPPLGDSIEGTIGGVFATNSSGPRRLTAGAARDYILGFKAVSGRGEAFQSGGRVMKNVTGYDLSKLMVDSYGTLAVMHEITFKTLPKPEVSTSLIYACANAREAGELIGKALASTHEPAMAWVVPNALAKNALPQVEEFSAKTKMLGIIRLEGFEISVKARIKALAEELKGKPLIVQGEDSDRLHVALRERTLIPKKPNDVMWKITCPPAHGGTLLDRLLQASGRYGFADWGGGLIWLRCEDSSEDIRAEIKDVGEAMLYDAPAELRKSMAVFHPQADNLVALMRKIKEGFDPLGILNPGRMIEGI